MRSLSCEMREEGAPRVCEVNLSISLSFKRRPVDRQRSCGEAPERVRGACCLPRLVSRVCLHVYLCSYAENCTSRVSGVSLSMCFNKFDPLWVEVNQEDVVKPWKEPSYRSQGRKMQNIWICWPLNDNDGQPGRQNTCWRYASLKTSEG